MPLLLADFICQSLQTILRIILDITYEKGYGANHSPWGIISCSVFHFHEDTLIFRFHELRHPNVKSKTQIKFVPWTGTVLHYK